MAGKNTAAQMLSAGRGVTRPRPSEPPEQTAPAPAPAPVGEPTSRPVALQYEKASHFLTPDQRRWLDDTVHALNLKGIGSSDIVRAALVRYRESIDAGDVDLAAELIDQAYREVEQFPGRKNRGMPPRPARLP
jgi:hypothetical protein